jgi:hypothetical protein
VAELSAYFTEGRAWADFESLETQMDELELYVTIEPHNARTYSRKISLMLFQAASQVETFFKQALLDNSLDQSTQIDLAKLAECRTKLQNDAQIKISEFRDVFDPLYQLSRWHVNIGRPFLQYGEIQPFLSFSRKQSPSWWRAYNKVKHDMFNNRIEGKLENLLQAMAGLFLLNVLHRPNQPVLILKDVIRNGVMIDPMRGALGGLAGPILWEKLAQIGVPQRGQPLAIDIWARSKYFAVVLMLHGNWI